MTTLFSARAGRAAVRIGVCALVAALLLPVRWSTAQQTSTADSVGAADAPAFAFPVDCDYGRTCFIQNYVDTRAGDGRGDYACGHLSYDGHEGTDIRVRDWRDMRRGVDVLASAPGVVRATRDGMPDISVRQVDPAMVAGREAGNGVAIRHDDGWETQYSHLKRGSIRVERGDRVDAGDVIGQVGLSGRTEFPHVEFAVRRRGQSIDPFTGRPPESGCGRSGRDLWRPDTARRIDYVPAAVLSAGFAAGRPDADRVRRSGPAAGPLPTDRPLTFWVNLMGPRSGDVQRLRIVAPNDRELLVHREQLTRDQARRFTYVGQRAPEGGWPPGCYRGYYSLVRDNERLVASMRRIGVGGPCPDADR